MAALGEQPSAPRLSARATGATVISAAAAPRHRWLGACIGGTRRCDARPRALVAPCPSPPSPTSLLPIKLPWGTRRATGHIHTAVGRVLGQVIWIRTGALIRPPPNRGILMTGASSRQQRPTSSLMTPTRRYSRTIRAPMRSASRHTSDGGVPRAGQVNAPPYGPHLPLQAQTCSPTPMFQLVRQALPPPLRQWSSRSTLTRAAPGP